MVTTYPKSGLQDRVAFQQNGKPGVYPVQAWNDEIGTFQFLSTLAEGSIIPAGAAVVLPKEGDGVRLPAADDTLVSGSVIPAKKAEGSITVAENPQANDTITVGSVTLTFDTTAGEGKVEIESELADTCDNLITALTAVSETTGVSVGSGETVGDIPLIAVEAGVAGNSIDLATTSSAITLSGDTLEGGADASEAAEATATFAGVAVFSYYMTAQTAGYSKAALDVNVPVKQKGYVTVLMSGLEGAAFEVAVALDFANPGKFKVAGENDVVVGKINKVFPDYGTAEILLKEFI